MGQLRKDLEDLEDNGQLGDWCFAGNDYSLSLWLRYPCADNPRGDFVRLPVIHRAEPKICWQWDGNREAPTLSPSILVKVGGPTGFVEKWHGYLRAGKLETVNG